MVWRLLTLPISPLGVCHFGGRRRVLGILGKLYDFVSIDRPLQVIYFHCATRFCVELAMPFSNTYYVEFIKPANIRLSYHLWATSHETTTSKNPRNLE